MKKRLFATLLALVMALGLTVTAAADDLPAVSYIDPTQPADQQTQTCDTYTLVTSSSSTVTWGEAEQTTWYVVKGDVTIETLDPVLVGHYTYTAVNVKGTVNLILCDGATLTVNQWKDPGHDQYSSSGIYLYDSLHNSQLTIYGQSNGTGQLVLNANVFHGIAIRSHNGLTINGGSVTANGRFSGIYGSEGTITINGGKVKATGGFDIEAQCTLTLPASYRWRTAANGVYTASADTPYGLGGVPYIEIITTQPVVTPPADEPEPEPEQEPSAPAHEPIRRQNTTAVKDTTDTADTTKADEAKTDTVTSAKTFDAGVAVYGAMAALSLTGTAWVARKKF